jgi:ubiquinone/menaquinone biosynthesis C-methylase UbiE
MRKETDPQFLVRQEYADSRGLEIRNAIQAQFSSRERPWFSWLFDHLEAPTAASILELGCGSGALWLENLDRIPGGWRLYLSDLVPAMLQEARGQLPERRFHFMEQDAQAIACPTAACDVVLAIGLFDQLPDRSQAFSETQRVLKPGGYLVASAGGRTHLQEIEALVAPFVPDADYGGDPGRFGLENGLALLAPWFTAIERFRYDDILIFQQVEPLLAYILSETAVRSQLNGHKLADFVHFLQERLAQQGRLEVTTEKALFTARKEA